MSTPYHSSNTNFFNGDDNLDNQTPTYRNSYWKYDADEVEENRPTSVSSCDSTGGDLNEFRPTEMRLTAVEFDQDAPPERPRDYKGRIRTWPGILLLLLLAGGAGVLITMGARSAHSNALDKESRYGQVQLEKRRIRDGLNRSSDLIDDDGQVGNPKKYPDLGCQLPNYESKNGSIYAVARNGTEVRMAIKGVNWFGMETGNNIPFGMWENSNNGTSIYEIASFLSRHKFNSVRLPVSIKGILKNSPPVYGLVNMATNRAMNITNYKSTLQSIIEALAFRRITVLISMHNLDPYQSGGKWYSEELGVSEDDFLTAIGKLTEWLCSPKYWNVIGLDLKNEPHQCGWGFGEADWQKGATLIGNKMLDGCPNWLAFVEGVNGRHSITMDGVVSQYYDWYGGGLENAGVNKVVLNKPNKVVYAPHYYNTGVMPAGYLYGGGKGGPSGTLLGYVELPDEKLKYRVRSTMNAMFGYLVKERKEAILLGEFAGLYAKDAHPMKTTQRTTDVTLDIMREDGYAGGYVWCLNPESAYQFNPADTAGNFIEGLLMDDWVTPNEVFLKGMTKLDDFPDRQPFPCFPEKALDSDASGSS